MFCRQSGHCVDRALDIVTRLERVNGGGIKQFACGIDDGNLDAGAYPRVQAHGGFLARRGGQQQVFQIVGKHLDRIFFGAVAQIAKQIQFDR